MVVALEGFFRGPGLFGNIKFAEILKQTSSLFNDETMVMMMLEPKSSNSELWPDGFGMLHFNAGWCASDFQDAISELTGPEIPLYIVHISSVLFAKSLQWVIYPERDLGLIIFGFAKVSTGFDKSLALPESEAKAIVAENWDRAKQEDFNWLWEKLR